MHKMPLTGNRCLWWLIYGGFSGFRTARTPCFGCLSTVKYCCNTTNLVKRLKLNHNTEYDKLMSGDLHKERKIFGTGRQRQIWNYWQRLSLSLTFKEVITSVIGFSLCVDIQTMGVPRILKTTECSIMKVAYQVSVSYWNWPYQSKFYTLEWKAVVTHHKLTVNVFPIFLSNPSNCCCDIEFWTNRGALVAPQSL